MGKFIFESFFNLFYGKIYHYSLEKYYNFASVFPLSVIFFLHLAGVTFKPYTADQMFLLFFFQGQRNEETARIFISCNE